MAAGHDAHLAAIGKCGALVAVLGRHLGQRGGHVQLRHRGGRGAYALRLRGHTLAHAGEKLLFERQDLLLGIQHFALVILQLGGGEALGVGQRLLAFVIRGRQVLVGARDFDVVAEHVVEPHLERLDAGALPFARFDLRDVLAAVAAEVAQLVELGVEAGADGAAVGDGERRLVGDGFQDEICHVGQLVEALMKSPQTRRLLGIERALERGDFIERAAERQQIAGAGGTQRHLGQQALEIENAFELLAKLRAQDGLLEQLAHRLEALLDFGAVHGGPQQALAEKPAAHAGRGPVEDGKQCGLGLAAGVGGEQRLHQFQIANGDGVEHHGIGAVVVSGPVEVVERRPLRVAEVVQDGARRAHRRGTVGQPAAIEREQLEMVA